MPDRYFEKLAFEASHTYNGFTSQESRLILVANYLRKNTHDLIKEEMKNCRWLKPELVAQIEFAEWTPRPVCHRLSHRS